MTAVYNTKMTQVASQFAAVMAQIKTMNTAAVAAAAGAQTKSDDSAKLEGLSLVEVVELIAGTTGLTVQSVKDELDIFIARRDNPNVVTAAQVGLGEVANFGVATNIEALDALTANKVITPVQLHHVLNDWWAGQVGSTPETLDTIQEIATALQDNPDVIATLQTGLALKASQADLDAAVATLNTAITAAEPTWATNVEALAGIEAAKAMSPASMQAVRTEMEQDVTTALTALETSFTDALAALQA